MSRSSPTGFAFGILFEVAAVVVIVSFLPRVDLRPLALAVAGEERDLTSPSARSPIDAAVSPAGWTATEVGRLPTGRVTSYYERHAMRSDARTANIGSFAVQPAPPLIELESQRTELAQRPEFAQRPEYVEQRLDRASQQLVNSVGTAVASATDSWLRPVPATQPMPPRVSGPTMPAQPRPWIRY